MLAFRKFGKYKYEMSFSVPRTLDKDLYGPTRISAKTDIKDILLGDHVLQEGEWCPENVQHKPWTTSFSISFQVRFCKKAFILIGNSLFFKKS